MTRQHSPPAYRDLLRRVAADIEPIVVEVARDVDETPDAVRPAVRALTAALDEADELTASRRSALRDEGARAARDGIPLPALLDRYLSAGWVLWEAAIGASGSPGGGTVDPGELVPLGASLLRAGDVAAAALADGYASAAREAVARSASARHEFLDELLELPAGDRAGLMRLARRALALGMDVELDRDVIVAWLGREVADEDPALDMVVRAVSPPPRGARALARPADPPMIGMRRGHLFVLLPSGSTAGTRLAVALQELAAGRAWLGVRARAAGGLAGVAAAYAEARHGLVAGRRAGVAGAIVDVSSLLLERALLADATLTEAAVDRELGPLRRAERGGDALVATLHAFLSEGHNLRATARRLGIAPRTVSYRLARVERIRGTPLDGDAWLRLAAALFAERLVLGMENAGSDGEPVAPGGATP